MYKCVNCVYEGEEAKNGRFCPVCGDDVFKKDEPKPEPKEEVVLATRDELKEVKKGPLASKSKRK